MLHTVQKLEDINSLKEYSEDLAEHINRMLNHFSEIIRVLFQMLSIGGSHLGLTA